MKKSIMVLIATVLFLVACMYIVTKQPKYDKKTTFKDMDISYIESNYETHLFDELVGNEVVLKAETKYIGKDDIKEIPQIKLKISCTYIYEDADQVFTDLISDNLIISNNDDKMAGELKLSFKKDSINSYSCSYKIIETSGKYIEK